MPNADQVKSFWEKNPVAARENPFTIGTKDFFLRFDKVRNDIEPAAFSSRLYQFDRFRNCKVLEVGSGNGYVMSHYARAGADVYGVDITQAGVDLCNRRFDLFGLKGTFKQGSAEALPFDDNFFDAVCSMGVLHHVPDTKKGVSEIFRVLKPGGRFVVMLYHRNSVLYRFKFPLLSKLQGKSIQQLVNEVDGEGNPKGDVYSVDEARALFHQFADLKLEIRLIQGWMLLPKVGRLIPDFLLKPFASRWGWFLYITGVKPLL